MDLTISVACLYFHVMTFLHMQLILVLSTAWRNCHVFPLTRTEHQIKQRDAQVHDIKLILKQSQSEPTHCLFLLLLLCNITSGLKMLHK